MIPSIAKATAAVSGAFAGAGVVVAQVQGTTTQLQANLPTVLIVFGALAGLVGIIYAAARALYALHGVAVGWVQTLAAVEVDRGVRILHDELGTIKEMVAQLRGEQRIIRIKLGADPYPTPPSPGDGEDRR